MTLWSVILLVSLWLGLSGCALTSKTLPVVPRPVLESAMENNQGGICLDKSDTAELLHYLDALEAR